MITNILVLDGKKFTRKSDRTYTHVLIGRRDVERDRHRSITPDDKDTDNALYDTRVVAGTHPHAAFKRDDGRPGTWRDQLMETGCTASYDNNLALIMAEKKDDFEKKLAAGWFDLQDLRWSMSQAAALSGMKQHAHWGFIDLSIHLVTEHKTVGRKKAIA